MPKYFSKFPKILHSFDGKNGTLVTNLLVRVKLSDSILNNGVLYYDYAIQEGDLPEIVAEKFYSDSEKHWLVLMTNKIIDPYYEWPLTYQQFLSYINGKYTTVTNARSTIHHYEKIVESTDSASMITTVNVYEIDLATYNGMVAEPVIISRTFPSGSSVTIKTYRKVIYSYDYEEELNESRRNIKLLRAEYAGQAESDLLRLMAT